LQKNRGNRWLIAPLCPTDEQRRMNRQGRQELPKSSVLGALGDLGGSAVSAEFLGNQFFIFNF
jgi:hypothetical protein